MTTLITGGTGFVGLNLAEHLLAHGERVVLFGAAPPPAAAVNAATLAGATLVLGDVRSIDDIDRALSADDFDCIIHTAAITPDLQRETRDAGSIIDVNIRGTVNMVERAAAQERVRRVVVVSSVAVYGFSPPAASGRYEEQRSTPAPAALYGITKLAAEQAALRLAEIHRLDVRVARLGPTYGPWEYATGVRDALSPHRQVVADALAGREIVLGRRMIADWIYSRDAAAGIAALAQASLLHHLIYNVGGGRLTDLAGWCEHVAQHIPGMRWRVAQNGEPGTVQYGLPQDRAGLSIARLAGDAGFECGYDMAAAARDYVAWVSDHDHELKES
jgi:UDP-glucose 4-epimerase/UDP-glucuronate 4-epimerase